jgi:hypothetical protein
MELAGAPKRKTARSARLRTVENEALATLLSPLVTRWGRRGSRRCRRRAGHWSRLHRKLARGSRCRGAGWGRGDCWSGRRGRSLRRLVLRGRRRSGGSRGRGGGGSRSCVSRLGRLGGLVFRGRRSGSRRSSGRGGGRGRSAWSSRSHQGSGSRSAAFTGQGSLGFGSVVRQERSQDEGQEKHQPTQPRRALLQHIGRVSASQRVHHAGAEGCAKALLTRTLHQDNEDEEQTDNRRQHHEEANKNRHRGGEYGTVRFLGKGNRFRHQPLRPSPPCGASPGAFFPVAAGILAPYST